MTLNEEQKKLASDNHNLIYYFLKTYNYNFDEYYDLAAIGLCRATLFFKEDKGKFSTYAIKFMRNEIFKFLYNKKSIKEFPFSSIEGEDDFPIINSIISEDNRMEDKISYLCVNSFLSILTKEELEIVYHFYKNDIKKEDVAKKLGYSRATLYNKLNKIRNKYLSFKNEELK